MSISRTTTVDEAVVEVVDLVFAYERSQPIIQIEDLRLGTGDRVFLHGPSGCGKSTLLGLLTGILTPQHGAVRIKGSSLGALTPRERDRYRGANIGYIFQAFNLLPYLSVQENIALPCELNPTRLSRVGGMAGLGGAVEDLCGALGIVDLLDSKAGDLSVGQAQRVAAARAMIGSPSLLVADEPTSALDRRQAEAFVQLLFDHVPKTTTVLFVSHDHQLGERFGDSINLPDLNGIPAKGEVVA